MPELPDIEAYIEALRPRVIGKTLHGVRLAGPFVLRTVDPPLSAVAGGRVEKVTRLGKQIVVEITEAPGRTVLSSAAAVGAVAADAYASAEANGPLYLVVHLMIAGRLHWKAPGSAIPKGRGLAALDFDTGSLILTEAGKKRRASIRLVRGCEALSELDPGGIEVLGSTPGEFEAAMRRENRTLKRALTDPHRFSGIGNAYSDEILHRARLSPLRQTAALDREDVARLHAAATEVLGEWTERLRAEARDRFPDKVTAFRPDMAAHGRFGRPCPVCGVPIQRIVYADNECDYCPGCQTGGRILADRALSRLLKDDWPRSLAAGPSTDG
jgi:formamidopyrimidine-DNA glycosylase